jgi:hypothetical protein
VTVRTRLLLRAFLVLTAGLALSLTALLTWVASPPMSAPRRAAIAAGSGAVLAALGLCMTRGDPGDPLRTAARTLAVLIGLTSAVVALFLWAASTTGGGE